ncbi:MAG: Tfp pilus assembly protein FimT/FimU [Microcystaceae cyanobacterium]
MMFQTWQRFTLKSFLPTPSVAPNQGWTLIEMAAVAIITGVLAALTVPSMIGMQARTDLQGTASQIKGAFQEAQRSAIRRGATCTVNVVATGITGDPPGCISSPVTLNTSKTTLTTDPTATSSFQFDFKGNG